MSETDLTEIDGVGDDTAASLRDDGFESVADVADASVADVSGVEGFGESRAEDTVENAADLVDVEDDSNTESTEESADDADDVEDGDEEDTLNSALETYTVELLAYDKIHYHIIHVVLEQATRHHQSGEVRLRNTTFDAARKLMESFPMDGNDEVEFKEDELDAVYRALKRGSTDYAQRQGIPDMYGELNTFCERVNEQRRIAINS